MVGRRRPANRWRWQIYAGCREKCKDIVLFYTEGHVCASQVFALFVLSRENADVRTIFCGTERTFLEFVPPGNTSDTSQVGRFVSTCMFVLDRLQPTRPVHQPVLSMRRCRPGNIFMHLFCNGSVPGCNNASRIVETFLHYRRALAEQHAAVEHKIFHQPYSGRRGLARYP